MEGNIWKKERVKTKDGTMLVEKQAAKERWYDYFEGLLNQEDGEAEIDAEEEKIN